jgi:two-component system, NtrC family, nitrogen regulation sensor histidine kinase NtrY
MKIRTLIKKRFFWVLLTSAILLFFSLMQQRDFSVETKLQNSLDRIQSTLLQKENSLQNLTNNLAIEAPYYSKTGSLKNDSSVESFQKSGNAFYVFKDSNLIYWSTNRIPVPSVLDTTLFSKSLVQLLNGWYLKSSKTNGRYTVIGLSLVKNNFLYENVYLENSFAADYRVDPSVQLQLVKDKHNVFDSQKRFLFSLYIDEDKANADYSVLLSLTLLFFTFLFFVYGLYLLLNSIYPNRLFLNSIYYSIIATVLIGTRLACAVFHFPQIFYQSKLFSPIYYASSKWLPSLGDLLLNTIVLLLVVVFIKKAFQNYPKNLLSKRWVKAVVASCLTIAQFFAFSVLIYLIQSVVFNSSVAFNNDSIFNYTYIHYLVFIIIGLWILIFVVISYHFLHKGYQLFSKKVFFWILFTMLLVLFTFVNYSLINVFGNLLVFFISYYLIIAFLLFRTISLNNIWAKISLLLLFSIFVTQALYSFYYVKEREERFLLAEKLGTQHDPITEYRLDEVSALIAADQKVSAYVGNLKKDEATLLDYLDRTYLSTFSTKYKVSVTICKQNQILKLQPDNYKIECALYFDKKIATVGSPTKFNQLWFMNYLPGQISYLLVVEVNQGDHNQKIYIELDSKMYATDSGYPELLIDKKQRGINKDFSRYSYARFVNNDLVNQYGKYSYSVKLNYYKPFKNNTKYFEYEGYSHLYYQFTNNETIILSKHITSTLKKGAAVSYYFLLYGLILLIISVVQYNPIRLIRNKMTFQLRMQMYMTIIILVSFVLVGTVTINYFLTLNQKKNVEFVNEKIHSILIQFEEQLNNKTGLTDDNVSYINQLVYQLSVRYFADINVYDAEGQMIATSRPQMFQQGLMQDKMNSEALSEFNRSRRTLFFHDEFIGKQKYWSVYMPYFSNNGEVMMYINMPYFAKQKELNSEISSFVVTFLSVYMLIIFITIIIALLLARYISRPLLLIKERMSSIQLGDKNEKIAWKSTDEIGKLVEVYNTMVDELRQSAELLASSQREQAWREMAQQVAHEIKNPLTPMKLSVQMLERTWKNGDPNWEERLSQFSKTLIEQIDTLADIASSFSNFAKMPQGNSSEEDLHEIVTSVIQLHNYPSVEIRLHSENGFECPVYLDKNQLIRVFNNLIKNAVQSFGNQPHGEIEITIRNYDIEFWEVIVKDNGSGIPETLKDRIFSPNFTTKSSGMGLGLAMVKNIIVDFGGNIWFNSEVGKGTAFYFTVPKRK